MQNAHRVVTRAELERELWGERAARRRRPARAHARPADRHRQELCGEAAAYSAWHGLSTLPIPSTSETRRALSAPQPAPRIAGTMLALVALAGVVLAAGAHLADEQRSKRNITFDLLSEELTHYEQRMRDDRGAEPLARRACASIGRATSPRCRATSRGCGPVVMHRVRSEGRLLDVPSTRRRLRPAVHHVMTTARCTRTRRRLRFSSSALASRSSW